MRAISISERLFPESGAGGYSRHDQRVQFYTRVGALLRPDMTVLDFGAGRGKWDEIEVGFRRATTNLKGRCRKLYGVDADPVVLTNPMVDEGLLIRPGERLPFEDATMDLVVSWATLEHIAEPAFVAGELGRILKPGGWLCAWTPNKWGYAGIGARVVPNALHGPLLRWLGAQGGRKEEDFFPTVYRMNTVSEIGRLFPRPDFVNCSFVSNGPPGYHANKMALARMIQLYGRLAPRGMGPFLHVFVRKAG